MSRKRIGERNFDDLGGRFARNIVAAPKGMIRQQVLSQHLLRCLPQLVSDNAMSVLDAGCGMGQMSAHLVGLGHRLTLCDVSGEMLTAARELLEQQPGQSPGAVTYIQTALQDLPGQCRQHFDLVMCHAVLEWLNAPQPAISALADLVAAGGHLSLTFYNRDALIYRNLINGNLRKVKSGDFAGHPGGMTPDNPLHPPDVMVWLEQQGFEILATAGLRVFYDYIPRKTRDRLPLEDIMELELQYSQKEPYRSLARYIHVVAKRRPTTG